jgi:hypothetical protein
MFEQYKLCVDMSDKISSRRLTANTFFLTLNSAILAFQSLITLSLIIALAGIALGYMWYRLIQSYSQLNEAKFKVIHEIEKKLPYKLFDAEWEALERGNNPDIYLSFTSIEKYIPIVFILLHSIILMQSIDWKFYIQLF